MKHQDQTNDTAVILPSPRSDFWILPHIICHFQMIVEFSPKDGVIHLLFAVQIPTKRDW